MNCGISNLAENLPREDIQELKRALGRSGVDKRSGSLAIGEVLGVRILGVGMDCAIPSEYLTEKGPKREKGAHENIRRGHVLWEEQSADVGNSAVWSTAWEVDCRDIMHRYIHEEGMNLEIQRLELLGQDSHDDAMV